MDPLIAVAVFACAAILDALWASYTLAVTARRPANAANYAALLLVLGAVGVIVYTDDPWYLLPIAAGSWAGTYLTTKERNV